MSWLPPHTGVRVIFYAVVAALALAGLYVVKLLLLPLVLGGLIALLLQPSVDRVEMAGFSQSLSITIVFGVFFLIVVGGAWQIGPMLLGELNHLREKRETYTNYIVKRYKNTKQAIEKRYPGRLPWEAIEEKFTQQPTTKDIGKLFALVQRLGSGIEWLFNVLLLAPLIAFFLLKDGLTFKKWALQFVPNRYFEMVMQLHYNINKQIVAFVRGQLADSMINATLLSIVLLYVGLPYAILIGMFGGMANAIPFIGPIVAGLLGAFVALVTGTVNPLLILLIFFVVHMIDVTMIYPKTVGYSLKVHELMVILGVFAGGYIGGIVGMLIAVPLIGITLRSMHIVYRTLKGYHIL